AGTNALFASIIDTLDERYDWDEEITFDRHTIAEKQNQIITNERRHYLREISNHVRSYHENTKQQSDIARKLYQLEGAKEVLGGETVIRSMDERIEAYQEELEPKAKKMLASWEETKEKYAQEKMTFTVRDKEINKIGRAHV